MKTIIWSAIGLMALAACTPSPSSELANPAAGYCVDQGGRYETRDTAAGQVGYCTLADGSEVDAWDYYRANAEG